MYEVHPNTTHINEVAFKKDNYKINQETRNWQRVEKFIVMRLGASVCTDITQNGMWQEKWVIFTLIDFLVWQVARRCWSGNDYAYETICQAMKDNAALKVTLPQKVVDENILEQALKS